MDVGQVFQDASVIQGGMAICDLDMAPAFERSKHHEEIGGAIALVTIVLSLARSTMPSSTTLFSNNRKSSVRVLWAAWNRPRQSAWPPSRRQKSEQWQA